MRLKITFVFIFLFLLTGCSLPFLSSAAVIPAPETTFTPLPSPSPSPTAAPTPEPYAEGFDLCGNHYSRDAVVIDLRGASPADLRTFRSAAPYLRQLRSVELGNDKENPLSWEAIRSLQESAPSAEFLYSFQLYGKEFTL